MIFSYSLNEIDKASSFIFKNIKSKTVLFMGDLGSGKTTLIKNICLQLGFNKNVTSPTFPILNVYNLKEYNIYHADLYRLDGLKDLNEIGFFDILSQSSWIFVEWPKKIIDHIDQPYSIIKIKVIENQKRTIKIENR